MYNPIKLAAGQYVTTGGTVLYTTGSDETVIIKEIILANNTGSSCWVRIHIAPTIGSPGLANTIFPGNPGGEIPPGAMVVLSLSTIMSPDEELYAIGETASAVTITVSGVTIQ